MRQIAPLQGRTRGERTGFTCASILSATRSTRRRKRTRRYATKSGGAPRTIIADFPRMFPARKPRCRLSHFLSKTARQRPTANGMITISSQDGSPSRRRKYGKVGSAVGTSRLSGKVRGWGCRATDCILIWKSKRSRERRAAFRQGILPRCIRPGMPVRGSAFWARRLPFFELSGRQRGAACHSHRVARYGKPRDGPGDQRQAGSPLRGEDAG